MLTREQEQQVEQTLKRAGNVKGLEYIQRLKNELRSKVEYIHEQDEIIDDYKHRAEVAERALLDCIKDSKPAHCSIAVCSKWTRCGDGACVETRRAIFIEQAEREIEEEKGK